MVSEGRKHRLQNILPFFLKILKYLEARKRPAEDKDETISISKKTFVFSSHSIAQHKSRSDELEIH